MDDQAIRHLRGIDRTLRGSAVGTLLMIAVWVLRDILLLAFASVLLACILRGASETVRQNSRLGSGLSLLAVVTLVGAGLGLLLWWRGAAIAEQAVQMTEQLSTQAQRLWEQLSTSESGAFIAVQLQSAARSLRSGLGGYFPGVASSVLGIGGSAIIVVATAAFLATSPSCI